MNHIVIIARLEKIFIIFLLNSLLIYPQNKIGSENVPNIPTLFPENNSEFSSSIMNNNYEWQKASVSVGNSALQYSPLFKSHSIFENGKVMKELY